MFENVPNKDIQKNFNEEFYKTFDEIFDFPDRYVTKNPPARPALKPVRAVSANVKSPFKV